MTEVWQLWTYLSEGPLVWLTLTLAASFLSFLRLSPDWQIGAQGAILILVLTARLLFSRKGAAT